ncbi:DDB1- and CUL4-associated factor 12 [Desmophyllum pertusum]|uniref:DDB1- and CUL4-associated factor 12 n=1 Tax=Desmophyllum pertusum TaxID=174260 RepID=A0A9X0D2W9_9CNID|nr:DDB1- and CUL4-associated factor 12 [Desmophyllum pertusum]
MSLFKHVSTRQLRCETSLKASLVTDLTTRHIPTLLKEREISLRKTDKVFASQWLDEKKVVCGTKSNELIVLGMLSDWSFSIPVLEGSPRSQIPECNCGIHSIEISPARTLLATSGQNPNNMAVYRLPTFDPVCVGEGHSDWIFSVEWIDDFHLATGSRDGSIALWCVQDPANVSEDSSQFQLCIKSPANKLYSTLPQVYGKDKIRDLVYEKNTQTLISLSARGFVHLWDMNTCQERSTFPMKYPVETVCLSLEKDNKLFAVGSQSHVSFYDPRSGAPVGYIGSPDPGAGVRSLTFRDLLLSVGTGFGSLFFFDMRAYEFLGHADSDAMICFRSGKGWLREEPQDPLEEYMIAHAVCRSNAIYTHCYDPTGTKLFAAGGPLSLAYYGNYAALWE